MLEKYQLNLHTIYLIKFKYIFNNIELLDRIENHWLIYKKI